ncbi:MAG: DUF1064 domain-containing protein [Clostridiales bacterium]|nr:DUF1064 domain-containing protein [Clostridiales bacterium]
MREERDLKYRNRKTIIDGITFDSKGEANRYCELKLLQRAGEISDLTLQPKFTLQESFKKNGKTHRAITYIADFQYQENGKTIIEDYKGMETEVFRIKRKLFEKRYPDKELRIVRG